MRKCSLDTFDDTEMKDIKARNKAENYCHQTLYLIKT